MIRTVKSDSGAFQFLFPLSDFYSSMSHTKFLNTVRNPVLKEFVNAAFSQPRFTSITKIQLYAYPTNTSADFSETSPEYAVRGEYTSSSLCKRSLGINKKMQNCYAFGAKFSDLVKACIFQGFWKAVGFNFFISQEGQVPVSQIMHCKCLNS